ncbi:MAG: YcxB family protein [Rhizomicrobium sp.]
MEQIDVRPAPGDCRAFAYSYYRRNWWQWVLFLAIFVVYGGSIGFGDDLLTRTGLVPLNGFPFGLGIGIVLLLVLMMLWRRRYQRPSQTLTLLPYTFAISPAGLRHARDGSTTETQWRVVHDVQMAPQHLFILLNPRTAYSIPRHAFASDEAFKAFGAQAQAYYAAVRQAS